MYKRKPVCLEVEVRWLRAMVFGTPISRVFREGFLEGQGLRSKFDCAVGEWYSHGFGVVVGHSWRSVKCNERSGPSPTQRHWQRGEPKKKFNGFSIRV